MNLTPLYFFGCWAASGHYLWGPKRSIVSKVERLVIPVHHTHLDGAYAPKDPLRTEGRAAVHHVRGWTIVGWWDRSVDGSWDSNSAFVMKGQHPLSVVLLEAGAQYPDLLPRFATLVEVKP